MFIVDAHRMDYVWREAFVTEACARNASLATQLLSGDAERLFGLSI